MGFGRDIAERKRYQISAGTRQLRQRPHLSLPSVMSCALNGIVGFKPHPAGYRSHREQEKYLKTIP